MNESWTGRWIRSQIDMAAWLDQRNQRLIREWNERVAKDGDMNLGGTNYPETRPWEPRTATEGE